MVDIDSDNTGENECNAWRCQAVMKSVSFSFELTNMTR